MVIVVSIAVTGMSNAHQSNKKKTAADKKRLMFERSEF